MRKCKRGFKGGKEWENLQRELKAFERKIKKNNRERMEKKMKEICVEIEMTET